jgi:hypothetical protein
VTKIIASDLSNNPIEKHSFKEIFNELEEQEFRILPDVNTDAVSAFAI